MVFLLAADLLPELEFEVFLADPAFFDLLPLPAPTSSAPVSIAPDNAPLAAPLMTSVKTSAALLITVFAELPAFFPPLPPVAFFAGAVFFAEDDFEALEVDALEV